MSMAMLDAAHQLVRHDVGVPNPSVGALIQGDHPIKPWRHLKALSATHALVDITSQSRIAARVCTLQSCGLIDVSLR